MTTVAVDEATPQYLIHAATANDSTGLTGCGRAYMRWPNGLRRVTFLWERVTCKVCLRRGKL